MDKIVKKALKQFQHCVDAETENRKLALDDLKFRAGEQWEDNVQAARKLARRPCLTINRVPQFVRQVTNDARMNRPSIKITPVEDNDVEKAEIYEGLVRQIQVASNADVAYDTAVEYQATMGFGFIRVVTEYESPESFNQVIRIKRVKNPFMVYLDPAAQEPDGSDAKYGFVITDMQKQAFEDEYPNAKKPTGAELQAIGDTAAEWMADDYVRVAEYFAVEEKEADLLLLSDGVTLWASEYETMLKAGQVLPEVVKVRKADKRRVVWRKMTVCEVLDEKEWPGQHIPIVPVYGDDLDIDGKRQLSGMVRGLKDPQRMYNYWSTAQTEAIALAPKAPFLIAEGQVEGFEKIWQNANLDTSAYLVYKPTTVEGLLVPMPQRQQAEPPVQAMVQAIGQASEDMKATTGVYDASLGARSNETSGRAIQARRAQGDTANFHYLDNLSRSIRQVGVILVDLIPKIYDSARVIRILGEDGESKSVLINQLFQDKDGQQKQIDLSVGKFDVTVQVGPSYATKRLETADMLSQLSRDVPIIGEAGADILVQSMDFPRAQELAKRIKEKMGIKTEQDGVPEIPPELKAQMDQAQQVIDALTEQLNALQQEKEMKTAEIESRERIALSNNETKLAIEIAKAELNTNLQVLLAEMQDIRERMALIGKQAPIDTPQDIPFNDTANYGGQPLA